jgi:ribonuclease P protein subunit RPR2
MREMFTQTIGALAEAVDKRDPYTSKHSIRVKEISVDIGRVMHVNDEELEALEWGGLLHDVGKIGVPDSILHKPEPLTPQERELIQLHPITGWEIVRQVDFLGAASDVVRHHHERWDGGGYPDGLKGEDIPLTARVFAVADTFDALTTTRPYRPASPITEARVLIAEGRGTQFDPAVVDAFANMPDDLFERIRAEIA